MRLSALAVAVGLATASCSGARGVGSLLPSAGAGGPAATSKSGARTTREVGTAVAPPAGWASTATQAFSLKDATDLGALSPAQPITVRLGLQLHDVDALKAAVQLGAVLSRETVASYGPTAAEVARVTSYLQAQGLGNVTVEPNNLLVSASGTAAQIQQAFNTTLHAFSQSGLTVHANTTPAFVPAALGGIVVAVLGLNDAQTFKTKPHKGGHGQPGPSASPSPAPTPSPQPESPCSVSSAGLVGLPSPQPEPSPAAYGAGCLRNYTPSDYWRAYDARTTPAATRINVAVMAEGNVQSSIADFRVNEQHDALVPVPVVVKQVGLASPDTSGADEWTLDMIASTGMARAVQTLYLYTTTSLTDSDIALEYSRWVTDHLAPIGNSSFGGCESGPYLDGAMLVDDEILLTGAAQGQTMFASSGDSGSFCSVGTPNGVPAGAPLVEYPAASPYVVAVGGTTLDTQPDGTYSGESAWDASGGGISQFESSPSWQNGVQPASTTPAGASFRGIPDVAMDGDLQTGMIVYTASTGWTVIGGTSLSSPLAAGVWARMLQGHPSLGFASPRLYRTFASSYPGTKLLGPPPTISVGPYHDVISGSNGIYAATTNYDYTTGLGSVDVDALNDVIAR